MLTGLVPGEEWWRRTPQQRVSLRSAAARHPAGSPVAFWALMVFMFILFIAPQEIFPVLASFRIALLAAGVAVTAHVVDCFTTGRQLLVRTRAMKLAACLFGWGALTIPFSYWPGGSLSTVTDLFLKSLVLFWLIASVVTTVARLQQFAWGLSLMSIPIAATALTNYRSGTFLRGAERIVGYTAPLTSNPNDLALTLNLILPFALALTRITRGPIARLALVAIVALNIAAVVLTFSRAGLITLVVVLGITILRLLQSDKRASGIALLAALLLCLPLLPPSYWDRIATITDIDSDPTGSSQARWAVTVGALRFVLSHPVIGAGVGADILAINEQIGTTWGAVHNAYLQYAVDLGLPGALLYLWLFAVCLRATSVGSHREEILPDLRSAYHLTAATRLSLIAFGVASLFHPVAYHFYFYYLAGLASAASVLLPTTPRVPPLHSTSKHSGMQEGSV